MFKTFLAEGMEARQQLSIGESILAGRAFELGCDPF